MHCSVDVFLTPPRLKCAPLFPGCRTGEAKLTKGFHLAARFIIHTVGPKYKSRYRTAAESSLYSCYRNVLQLAKYGVLVSWV